MLSKKIIGAAIEVHRSLGGPGLLEGIYEEALCHELALMEIPVQRQLPVQVLYKGIRMKESMYLDILVGEKVIIEVKAVTKNHPVFEAQLLTYMRLTGIKLGLVLNFGQPTVKDGLIRVVNGLY